ncbi:MAG: chemotaxis protein CheC [Methanolobus sp.]
MRRSAFIEVANILAGSYYNALSKFLNLSIVPSIPKISEGTSEEIFTKAKQHINGKMDHIFGLTTLLRLAEKINIIVLVVTCTCYSIRLHCRQSSTGLKKCERDEHDNRGNG